MEHAEDSVQHIFGTLIVPDPAGTETVHTTAKAALSKYILMPERTANIMKLINSVRCPKKQ